MKFITVRYPDHHNWHIVYTWCEDNCTDSFYNGDDWDNWVFGERNRMVQFKSELDAVQFALRWA